ncbi:MAG: hypothetical protein Tsb0020_43110 [Haliangiales bacterium]
MKPSSLIPCARAAALLIASVLSIGCIERPAPVAGMAPGCFDDLDCDTGAGEICMAGTCLGNPPPQRYAALLLPPEGRTQLVSTELPDLDIPADGQLGALSFAAPLELSGRVVMACPADAGPDTCEPGTSIAAHIHVRRPARIAGRPAFTTTATSEPGVEASGQSFTLSLPPTAPDVPYEVTVLPIVANSVTPGGDSADALAPPLRLQLDAESAVTTGLIAPWVLGDPDTLRTITGEVTDAIGAPIAGLRVFAIDHGVPMELAARSSSVGTTDDTGRFTLRVPYDAASEGDGEAGTLEHAIDLVIQPLDAGAAPTLRVVELTLPEPTAEATDVGAFEMPSYGQPVTFTIPVVGIDSGGDQTPVGNAEVILETRLTTSDEHTEAIFSVSTYTDERGNATLSLIPGSQVINRRYTARITPPVDDDHASIEGYLIDVGATEGGFLAPVRLERRIAITGTLYLADGTPAAGSSLSVTPTVGFRWGLAPSTRTLIDSLSRPQTLSDQAGQFLLFVDPLLLGAAAVYDLEANPADARQPRWTWPSIDPTMGTSEFGTVELGDLYMPEVSYARATVLDASGAPVAGATVRLYALADDQSLCDTAEWPGDDDGDPDAPCQVPASYRGSFASASDGTVTLPLPDPRAQ